MNNRKEIQISKFLSLILRHKPEEINLKLDKNGWANISELIEKSSKHGVIFNIDDLFEIVKNSDKQRFGLNEDKTKIRANQGHSLKIDLELEEKTPPNILYHGTAERNLDIIKKEGLKKMSRQYVHLTESKETAINVGKRYGKPIILEIETQKMINDGIKFYKSKNGVWLVEKVLAKFLVLKED